MGFRRASLSLDCQNVHFGEHTKEAAEAHIFLASAIVTFEVIATLRLT